MERNYRLASVLGGLAGIAAVIFLATLALAGPRLGGIFSGAYLQPHHQPGLPPGDGQLQAPHGSRGCVGPCEPPTVHWPGDTSGNFRPIFNDAGQGLAVFPSFDADSHRMFPDGGEGSLFGPGFNGGGFGSHFPGGVPRIFTGGGGIPPAFLGNPPPNSGGSPPPDGGDPPPGGGNSPPGGGTTPPGGGTIPPGGSVTPTAVPEPTAWALFIFGVAAIGVALRSTRQR